MATQWIYAFQDASPDNPRALLGGKGAGLAEMTSLGLPVPPGFTITTAACVAFFSGGNAWPTGLSDELGPALEGLEESAGMRFGDASAPLLVSVRSGAPTSMPGMMDTILNLGLNDETVLGLAEHSGDPRFAWDSYRRFVQMFGDVVLGIHYTRFSRVEEAYRGDRAMADLTAADLEELTHRYQQVISDHGHAFPQDPREQLRLAIDAVFNSYNSHRARYYRKTHDISDTTGTAVNVQAMVFGNMGEGSGTGVAFTRNPKTGDAGLFGEWLPNAQGEDVVAGVVTPLPLNGNSNREGTQLKDAMAEAYAELEDIRGKLERRFRDMQDIEFTIQQGRLYLLQTRTGKRTGQAAVQIAVDMVREGLIEKSEALLRVEPKSLETVLRPVIAPDAKREVIARGLDASPGAACGRVVFDANEVKEFFENNEPTILVRVETSPEDIQGMTLAEGILTARGGQTSHAAVVARGMGKPCVVGCTDIHVDMTRGLFYAGDAVVRRGEWITVDGGTGDVIIGKVETLAPAADDGAMAELLNWADELAAVRVRANADTGADAERARSFGAVGIGLCRTEHMFFKPEALLAMREMILAESPRARQRALQRILPIQREMFEEMFRTMDGLPVTVRLLDPPLHEFLPTSPDDIEAVADSMGVRVSALRQRVVDLHESNPMLGHRGVRVGVTTPEVYQTQVRAIMEAACHVTRNGGHVAPEIMIPLVALPAELERTRQMVADVAEAVIERFKTPVSYRIGTMIEIPRAALMAGEVAEYADFFSFGTNDLTQLTYGFSRDDMGKFFPAYQRAGILPHSPLAVFDREGVGQLVRMATEKGRATKPNLKVGICGEHGGEPGGVFFAHEIGLDYVSCSPFRVPVARLAAAHAAIREN